MDTSKVLILKGDNTMEEAIRLLDENGNGVLPVVDLDNNFVGLITDGDVRKALINKNLNLDHIINRNPYKLNISQSRSQIVSFLKKIYRRQIPLVDDNNKFIKIFTLDELEFNLKPNWVVIMAGGLGSRLGELTRDIPKPMLKVSNRPMMEHIIKMFVSYGFTKFMISVNYKSEIIKDYFLDGSQLGIQIKYLEETKKLGTGGALSLIEQELHEPFFVTNGDVISTMDYEKLLMFHNGVNSCATMCVRKDTYQVPYGVIEFDENRDIIDIKEKPIIEFFINTGIYVFNPEVLQYIPSNEYFDLPNLFSVLKTNKQIVKSYEVDDYWIDIGNRKDFERINMDYKLIQCNKEIH